MKKNAFVWVAVIATFFMSSCGTADNKVPQIASDFCNCFTSMERDLSTGTKSIIAKAADAEDPEKSLTDAVMNLNEEEQTKIGTEMMSLGDMENESSEVGRCIKSVEKKYDNEYTLNQEKFAQKIVKELESKQGCSFTASLLKLGLKMEKKGK
jgi:hypothetical protein